MNVNNNDNNDNNDNNHHNDNKINNHSIINDNTINNDSNNKTNNNNDTILKTMIIRRAKGTVCYRLLLDPLPHYPWPSGMREAMT